MKALIVRFSAIGDCAMAAHTASCIRRSHPEATLVWAVEERCAAVVDEGKLTTARAIYPRERWKRTTWSPRMWREQMRYYARLRSFRFDIGLDLQGHSKTAICLKLSGAARRLAVRATDPFSKRLNPVLTEYGDAKHTVERQLCALRTFGEFSGDPLPIMPDLESERRLTREAIGVESFVVIAVGAGQPWKAYPRELWRRVASKLQELGQRIVFIGGKGEEAPHVPGAIDWVGKLDLAKTMAAIAECKLVLAADTGAGHLAAGYGVPVVSVFGPTDPDEFRPFTDIGIVLKEGERTEDVSQDQVVEAALRLLEKDGASISP